jgi:hypothetical protein
MKNEVCSLGKFSNSISKRFQHTRIQEGYCLICGRFGKLTQDHVPPQGSITISKVEQRHMVEAVGQGSSPVRGVVSPNGSKFKTICSHCNSFHLGRNDGEVARVNRDLTQKIQEYFGDINVIYRHVTADVDAVKYARAMAGHILSATSVEECKRAPEPSTYYDPIKEFVLGDDDALDHSHDIYYWFYPFSRHFSAKSVTFRNTGHIAVLSILSFFPIAFMLTKKNEGTFPTHARELQKTDTKLILDLSSAGVRYSEFPFCGLEGDQMMALRDSQAIVSYPIGQ